METLGVEASECLFIGDRPELDGICAERAGIPYLIIGKGEEAAGFYRQLQRQLLHATGKSEVATK
jgi:phosphoglycolate phosphatase/putative hydrolase of the HAD superfamily